MPKHSNKNFLSSRYLLICFSLLVFLAFLSVLIFKGRAEAEGRITNITIDANKIIGRYKPLYQGVNFMHHYPTYDKPLSSTELKRFKEIGFKYVRMMLPLTKIAPQRGKYLWGIDEYRMKQLTDNGVEILVAPNYVPSWISVTGSKIGNGENSKGIDSRNYSKYVELIKDIIRHYKIEKHYNIKYFEVFNEYNLYHWSPDQLAEIYKISAEAVKSVDSSILIGGPGTTGSPSKMKEFFAKIMDMHKNEGVPLDFVSWHNYYSGNNPSLIFDDIKTVRGWLKERNINVPIFLTEWAESAGGDKEARLGFAIWSIASIYYQEMAELDKSFIWELANPGAFTMLEYDYSGTPTPGFWIYKMLSSLDGNLVYTQPPNEAIKAGRTYCGVGAIATKNSNKIAVLIWNYHKTDDIHLSVKLPNDFIGRRINYQRFVIKPYFTKVDSPYETGSFIAGSQYTKMLKNNLWQGANLIILKKEGKSDNLDINKNGHIGIQDLGILLSHWGKTDEGRYDLNQDGKVDGKDAEVLLEVISS